MPVDVSDWEPVDAPAATPTLAPSASDWEPVATQSDWEPVDALDAPPEPTLKDDIAAGVCGSFNPKQSRITPLDPTANASQRLQLISGRSWPVLECRFLSRAFCLLTLRRG